MMVMVPIDLRKRMIKIDGTGNERRILLDGIDISRYVSQVNIEMRAGVVDIVTLQVMGFLDLPDELKALVTVEAQVVVVKE